ncbi:unnamed protein product [Ixodes pacificus]
MQDVWGWTVETALVLDTHQVTFVSGEKCNPCTVRAFCIFCKVDGHIARNVLYNALGKLRERLVPYNPGGVGVVLACVSCWALLALVRRAQKKRLCAVDLTVATARGQHIRDEALPVRRAKLEGRRIVVVACSVPDCCKEQFEVVLT